MKTIQTQEAPLPQGHYSQAIVHTDTVYLATQIPINSLDPKKNPGSVSDQTQQFFKNHKPARGIIPVSNLHKGYNVAMDVIAAVNIP